jgi:hypothetical protein
MSEVQSLNTMVQPFVGRLVGFTDETKNVSRRFKIVKLSDKFGALKNGNKAEYVILQDQADNAVLLSLHPRTATQLFKRGEDAGFKLLSETVTKSPSKKSLVVALYNKMVSEGAVRKEIVAKMKSDIGLSVNGANTYYQNCKSAIWA